MHFPLPSLAPELHGGACEFRDGARSTRCPQSPDRTRLHYVHTNANYMEKPLLSIATQGRPTAAACGNAVECHIRRPIPLHRSVDRARECHIRHPQALVEPANATRLHAATNRKSIKMTTTTTLEMAKWAARHGTARPGHGQARHG